MTDSIELTIELPNGQEHVLEVESNHQIYVNDADGTMFCQLIYHGDNAVTLKIFSIYPEDELDYARGLDEPPSQN